MAAPAKPRTKRDRNILECCCTRRSSDVSACIHHANRLIPFRITEVLMARHVEAVLVLAAVIVISVTAASAQGPSRSTETGTRCLPNLGAGFRQAASRPKWSDMFLTALDSELAFADCLRGAIIGR
jgi:hypothetical protein